MKKKIGFVDYYISEWHANNYPAWIKAVCEKEGYDCEIAYAWAEKEVSDFNGKTTDEWCAEFGAAKCETLEELCEKSDFILILAPSNPEKHLVYARTALKYGKRTYIDKTFAPCSAEANQIISLSERYSAPFFSSSALRYAEELADVPIVKHLTITGGGSNLEEYVVHMVEMAVILLSDKAVSATVKRCEGTRREITLCTESGKRATLIYSPELSFSFKAEAQDGTVYEKLIKSAFFDGLIADIMRFYETGECSAPINQLKEVMSVRDMILAADKNS